ncbi:MAG: ATP-binding protein [Elusimicrobiota bacterium]
MIFVDREQELEALNGFLNYKDSQFVVIYGKRRVGKTELIKHFIKNKPSVYFIAREISEKENLILLGKTLGNYFNDTILKAHGFNHWDDLFVYLKERLAKHNGHLILAIDEFPYLAKANKGISSIFQVGWDEYLKDAPVYLILCGSSIGMMEQEALAYKAPLYGRRTGQLFIKPLPYLEMAKFFPEKSFEERLRAYSVVGGIPAYILKMVGYASLEEAVEEEIFSREKVLFEEVEFILKEELREPRNYFAVIKAIGSNCSKVSEIINETGIEKSALHNYLFVLEDLHLIEKQVPVTEKNPQRSHKGRYYLCDQFFKFWFNYSYPFMNELELGNKKSSLNAFRSSFEQIVAQNYEKVAGEIVQRYHDDILSFHKIGRWWDKNEEIDLVALNETSNEILFGEVKWSSKPVGTNIYEELKNKAEKVEWGKKNRKEYFCLFSRSGFTDGMKALAKKDHVFLFEKDKLLK